MHFGCYDLGKVYENPGLISTIGDGVLIEIAEAFGYPLPDAPTVESLQELIGMAAPRKTLQDNATFTQELIGANAYEVCADWLTRAHAVDAVNGSFIDPTVNTPEWINTVVITGGVANWQLRRLAVAQQIDPDYVGQVLLPVGNRPMGLHEHQLVRTYAREYKQTPPTEAEFADRFILPALAAVGFKNPQLVPVDSNKGDDVLAKLFTEYPNMLEPDDTTLVVGNAPSTIQAAGQFRTAARKVDASYDYRGDQLFMIGDAVRIARPGEQPVHGQNAITGLGALLRNFLFLLKAAA